MSTATQIKRKAKVINPVGRRLVGLGVTGEEAASRQRSVREFISAMSAELAILAYQNRLDSLAVIFDMARDAAEEEFANGNKRMKRC
jgi:hypothetical protein